MGTLTPRRAVIALVSVVAGACSLSSLDDLKNDSDPVTDGGTNPDSGSSKDSASDVKISCPAGQKACGTSCVSLDSVTTGCSSASCEACELANGIAVCAGGECALASCTLGYEDCDGIGSNGCEIHTSVDPLHCGNCSTPCNDEHTTPTCVNGSCMLGQCDEEYGNCDGNLANGCEANFQTDEKHCGACGNDCMGYDCMNGSCCC